MSDTVMPPPPTAPELTPSQRRTFDELLAVGTDRPKAPDGLAADLEEKIRRGTSQAVARWTEPSMYFDKSMLATALACDGKVLADRRDAGPSRDVMHPRAVSGIIAHHAIQIAQTHRGQPTAHYVRESVDTKRRNDDRIAEFWSQSSDGDTSDVLMEATSKVQAFLSSWPPLADNWGPVFEQQMQAKVGKLKLSARMDLVLGSPKADGRQTMFLCDFKTGGLNDDKHPMEASFYALVATLRNGVPPFRSTVYSLAAGDWTDPDVNADTLHQVADQVVEAVVTTVDMLTEAREPTLTSGPHCRFCPALATCPAAAADPDVPTPDGAAVSA